MVRGLRSTETARPASVPRPGPATPLLLLLGGRGGEHRIQGQRQHFCPKVTKLEENRAGVKTPPRAALARPPVGQWEQGGRERGGDARTVAGVEGEALRRARPRPGPRQCQAERQISLASVDLSLERSYANEHPLPLPHPRSAAPQRTQRRRVQAKKAPGAQTPKVASRRRRNPRRDRCGFSVRSTSGRGRSSSLRNSGPFLSLYLARASERSQLIPDSTHYVSRLKVGPAPSGPAWAPRGVLSGRRASLCRSNNGMEARGNCPATVRQPG